MSQFFWKYQVYTGGNISLQDFASYITKVCLPFTQTILFKSVA